MSFERCDGRRGHRDKASLNRPKDRFNNTATTFLQHCLDIITRYPIESVCQKKFNRVGRSMPKLHVDASDQVLSKFRRNNNSYPVVRFTSQQLIPGDFLEFAQSLGMTRTQLFSNLMNFEI